MPGSSPVLTSSPPGSARARLITSDSFAVSAASRLSEGEPSWTFEGGNDGLKLSSMSWQEREAEFQANCQPAKEGAINSPCCLRIQMQGSPCSRVPSSVLPWRRGGCSNRVLNHAPPNRLSVLRHAGANFSRTILGDLDFLSLNFPVLAIFYPWPLKNDKQNINFMLQQKPLTNLGVFWGN